MAKHHETRRGTEKPKVSERDAELLHVRLEDQKRALPEPGLQSKVEQLEEQQHHFDSSGSPSLRRRVKVLLHEQLRVTPPPHTHVRGSGDLRACCPVPRRVGEIQGPEQGGRQSHRDNQG